MNEIIELINQEDYKNFDEKLFSMNESGFERDDIQLLMERCENEVSELSEYDSVAVDSLKFELDMLSLLPQLYQWQGTSTMIGHYFTDDQKATPSELGCCEVHTSPSYSKNLELRKQKTYEFIGEFVYLKSMANSIYL